MIKVLNLNLITSGTARDSYFLFAGTVISNLINFFILVLLSNNLSIAELGIFLTAVTFVQVLVDGLDLGINPALLNFLTGSSLKERNLYLLSSLTLKVLIGGFASMLVFMSADVIGNLIFNRLELVPFLQISSVGLFLMLIVAWIQIVLQSEKKFFKASIINTLPNIFRYLLLLLLVLVGVFNAINGYLYFNLAFIGALIIGLTFISWKREDLDLNALINYGVTLLKFGFPIGLSFMIAALYTRVDQLMLFSLAGAEQAGIYGLAFRLNLFFVFAATALNSAVVVRFASLEGKEFMRYFKKSVSIYFIMSLGILGSLVLTPVVWSWFFKAESISSILPFQILGIGTVFFIMSLPFASALLYRFKKNFFGLYISVFSLISVLGLLYTLIPAYQSIGAAISVCIVYALQLLITIIYFVNVINSKR